MVTKTIGEALSAAATQAQPVQITLSPGVYREKLTINLAGVTLIGPDLDATGAPQATIVWGDWAGAPGPDGQELGTFRTQTVAILAPDFRAERITFANSFPYPGPEGTKGTQAVAVKTEEASDRAVFVQCRFEGHQDTLFTNAGRSLLVDCFVEGHVDFLFGAGRTIFERCTIACLVRKDAAGKGGPDGYICAPSTRAPHRQGFLFRRCRLVKGSVDLAPGSYYLGRPWHPSLRPDTINAALFHDCWMDDHIRAEGWTTMDSRPGGVVTTYFPEDALLFECGSTGPGATEQPTPRRRWITPAEAKAALEELLEDWVPRELGQ